MKLRYSLLISLVVIGCTGPTMPVHQTGIVPAAPPIVRPKPELVEVGTASWYGREFAGKPTASGEPFDPSALTAAHPSLPFGTKVRVIDVATDRSVVVVINDRGPFAENRIIDLSRAAADALGFVDAGTTEVRIERVVEL